MLLSREKKGKLEPSVFRKSGWPCLSSRENHSQKNSRSFPSKMTQSRTERQTTPGYGTICHCRLDDDVQLRRRPQRAERSAREQDNDRRARRQHHGQQTDGEHPDVRRMHVTRQSDGRIGNRSGLERVDPDAVYRTPLLWAPGAPTVMLGGMPALNNSSTCTCMWGGMITITTPAQFQTNIP
jgi:hypothetical protein